MRTNKDYHIDKKESVLLMVAEGNEFELSVDYYNTLLSYIGWENKGIICVGGVKNPKDIDNNKKLNDEFVAERFRFLSDINRVDKVRKKCYTHLVYNKYFPHRRMSGGKSVVI